MAQSIGTQWDSDLQAGLGDCNIIGVYLALVPKAEF
jgi:hypothetical protein